MTSLDVQTRFFKSNALASVGNISFYPQFGAQLDYNKLVFIRFGINNLQEFETLADQKEIKLDPQIGLGFAYKGIEIDYALTNIGNAGGTLYSNTFSLIINLNKFIK